MQLSFYKPIDSVWGGAFWYLTKEAFLQLSSWRRDGNITITVLLDRGSSSRHNSIEIEFPLAEQSSSIKTTKFLAGIIMGCFC